MSFREPKVQPYRIAYIVSRFPKATETFIVNEAFDVVEQGFQVSVRSLSKSGERVLHSATKFFKDDVMFGSHRPLRLLKAMLRWAIRSPRITFTIWSEVAKAHWRLPREFVRAAYATLVGFDWAQELANADHVHVHWATYPAHVAWVAHRLNGLRFSVTAHAHDIQLPNPMLATKLSSAAFVVTISDFNREWLVQNIGSEIESKIHVVRCGVDTTQMFGSGSETVAHPGAAHKPLQIAIRKREAVDDTFTVVCVASFQAYKGHSILIEAFAELAKTSDRARLILVGDGELREAITSQIRAANIEPLVELRGWLPSDQVLKIVSEADVFVLASIVTEAGQTEGIPVALMEAMALGTPVISTRVSGIPELVIDQETGVLVEPGNSASLAAALISICSELRTCNDQSTAPSIQFREAADQAIPSTPRLRALCARRHVAAHYDSLTNTTRLCDLFNQEISKRT